MDLSILELTAKQLPSREDWDAVGVHWNIALSNGKQSLTTQYSEGYGHFLKGTFPRFKDQKGFDELLSRYLSGAVEGKDLERLKVVFERSGVSLNRERLNKRVKLYAHHLIPLKNAFTPPKLEDVLYSLVMDAQCGEYSFKEFCASLGYDEDSRTAEKAHKACRETYFNLKELGLDLNELCVHFEDY